MAREILAETAPVLRDRRARLRHHVEITIRLVSLRPSAEARASLRATAERLITCAEVAEWWCREDGGDGLSSSLGFLVPRDGIGEFLARIAPVAARAGAVAVVPTGPWAPSSFSRRLPGAADVRERLARAG
jgi:hypothetical protein